MDFFDMISIDPKSRKPIYQQIVDGIKHNISNGNFKMGEKIPSINNLSEEFCLSRDTVEKAYNILKKQKIIVSIRGKGNYVTRTDLISKINTLFLVNKLSWYKMKVFNTFVEQMGSDGHTDLDIYHCDESLFLKLMGKYIGGYDFYVIMPHFKTEDLKHISYTDAVIEALKKIPKDQLVILDNNKLVSEPEVIEIYQDFENDIYGALKEGVEKISRYGKLILVYPEKSVYPHPRRILHGFRKFCVEHHLEFDIIDEVYEDIILKKGDLFITILENDLINLVKRIREESLVLGKEIGVISYNDTPLKELLGITVISTDFSAMGEKTAELIIKNKKEKVKNPFRFIDRNSI